jgi:hypothetical protein
MLNLLWGTGFRRTLTSFFSLIAASAGAVVAVPPAWEAMGLPEVASRAYVHKRVHPIEVAQAQTTQAVNQLLLSNLQSSLYAAQRDMQTSPSQTVQERIDGLARQIKETEDKLKETH